ncbi:MAG TPA: dTDP-4-dehydrorhamnose reductase [Vitreimonas sp.]|uniref:dTDP-4-dehydrorhamnose reductase n=1 Tax=Vitreimonas sp. TaxID=3069702 RepID=UPI002D629503|nr:dTDP-4-dehydrorhamnose reductase [Vitreimonas sp.]HYD87721.1 dTDP-4-dehydrorhamnose reductase [Vitreimonas sp.]
MTILVIGRGGQVARALARRGDVEVIGRPDFDLLQPDAIAAEIVRRRPRVVINAAAYTAVDKAEDEPDAAMAINGEAVGAIARSSAEIGAALLHVSTDYVFAGDKSAPYVENDPTGPTGAYGASKLRGEQLALAANPRAIVLRTAWVFDACGANFVRTMLRLAKSRDVITVVADQHGCPTFADDLAAAALAIAADPHHAGIYHCAGSGETTWAAFAEEIFAQSRARGGPHAHVKHIASAEFPTRAKRPANSRLDCAKLAREYGFVMRPWREALGACLDEIAAGGWRVE